MSKEVGSLAKKFHVTGTCIPEKNYMVDISNRLDTIIREYIDEGKYFTINRARQYGKTTMLYLLERRLAGKYVVIRLSFEAADELFVSLYTLAAGLIRKIGKTLKMQGLEEAVMEQWNKPISREFPLDDLSDRISDLCQNVDKEIILMIDEVDKSSDNQVFLSFLGLLRNKYLAHQQGVDSTYKSVILAGVYDIKNLKLKIHPQEESKYNSPWNIAVDFDIDMSFSSKDISQMLEEYEKDYQTGMDIWTVSNLIHEYTSGYPYLVSRLCQLVDEKISGTVEFPDKHKAWEREGILAAEALLRKESNTLFDDMVKKLTEYPKLREMIQNILFVGSSYPFNKENMLVNLGVTFGFLKEENGTVAIANRIFETKMYDWFLADMAIDSDMYRAASMDKNQFIVSGMLQMNRVMEKFCSYFTEIYGNSDERFLEEQGRKLFLLYLKPIINGTGNYYVESRTRDQKRTDVIIDYKGRQFIVEMKVWRGQEYNSRGEKQLFEYLDYYGLDTGYMLSFSFNKKKKAGIQEISLNGKRIIEALV